MVVRLRRRRVQSGAAAEADRGETGMSEKATSPGARAGQRAIATQEPGLGKSDRRPPSRRRRSVFQQPALMFAVNCFEQALDRASSLDGLGDRPNKQSISRTMAVVTTAFGFPAAARRR